jgi:hypothetical protein
MTALPDRVHASGGAGGSKNVKGPSGNTKYVLSGLCKGHT